MNASVLWDIVSRAKIECHEAAGRVAFYLAILPCYLAILARIWPFCTSRDYEYLITLSMMSYNLVSNYVCFQLAAMSV